MGAFFCEQCYVKLGTCGSRRPFSSKVKLRWHWTKTDFIRHCEDNVWSHLRLMISAYASLPRRQRTQRLWNLFRSELLRFKPCSLSQRFRAFQLVGVCAWLHLSVEQMFLPRVQLTGRKQEGQASQWDNADTATFTFTNASLTVVRLHSPSLSVSTSVQGLDLGVLDCVQMY